jgi:hypothetical protein
MSTPISTLPLKTQSSSTVEVNDINDPVVQDVLNEFQDELMMSKQSKSPQQPHPPLSQHSYPPMPPMHPPHPQHPYSPHSPHSQHPQHHSYPPYPSQSKYDSMSGMSVYFDIEVAKRSLIFVILAVIIYHSGIISTVYEKLPDNLQDNLNSFDIYIKSISLFSIIYVLSFFEYL